MNRNIVAFGEISVLARQAAALDLLGTTLLRGPTPALRSNPVLGPLVPADPDQAAAEHHRLFSWEVLPYGAVFTTPEMLLGGAEARPTVQEGASEDPDHLGQHLRWLAFLVLAEMEAQEDRNVEARLRVQSQMRAELAGLALWVPPLLRSVELAESPLYAEILGITSELLAEFGGLLGAKAASLPPGTANPLREPKTGLRDLALWLCTPLYSGIWLSRGRLARLSRELGVPAGFGRREDVVETLLHTAVFQERLEAVREALAGEWGAWADWYGARGCRDWQERAEHGRQVLLALKVDSSAIG